MMYVHFVGEEAVRYLIPFGESKVCLMKIIGVGPVTKTPDTLSKG